MTPAAPRILWRLWQSCARGAWLAAGLWLVSLASVQAQAQAQGGVIVAAEYTEPTTRYDHAVLGDGVEWGALVLTLERCAGCAPGRVTLRLPATRVFEDLAPRVIDDGAGGVLAMVVESDLQRGARLALYDAGGLVSATPFIGQRHRWLAPVGAADLDGDGRVEIAYVDRPHLAKVLRIWRLEERQLKPVADLAGLSNHRIGWDVIPGGLRDCGAGSEIILADAAWMRVMAVRFDGALTARALGPYAGRDSLARALACR